MSHDLAFGDELTLADEASWVKTDKSVDSVCPYCGVGCQLTYHVTDNRIVYVTGRDGPANHKRLCVKGRYGYDYANHPQRLTKPLIRRSDVPKSGDFTMDPANPLTAFREASWDEALDFAAGGLKRIRDRDGSQALAGFGCAKGSNEEAYLVQKMVRVGFGTNNVDHCTRLCHASSVTALLECVGSGAISNPVADVRYADVAFLIGCNPIVNHPVAASWIKNAARRGTKLIYANPQGTALVRDCDYFLQLKPGSDVPLLNAMMHTILKEHLTDDAFIRDRTENYEAFARNLTGDTYSPEAMAPLCGIDAETIKTVARLYATSKASMIFWGMGISQHVHGTNNSRCIISLALMTGQVGRRGTGLHPLRGQNNVQGASDVGLIPMSYPDYQAVDDPAVRAQFEKYWGAKLDPNVGLTVVEIADAAYDGKIKGIYIMGENPALSDPNSSHARAGLANLEHLVVQDIFLTETAYLANVVLPASAYPEKSGTFTNTDRLVQLSHPALEPPGEARQDLWIIQEIARRIGLDWHYAGPADVFKEIRGCLPNYAGITWERLQKEGAVVYPCLREGDPGNAVVFQTDFPRPGGKGLFVPVGLVDPAELPDKEYPYVLMIDRELEHWHTGSMTRRSRVLDAIEPDPTCYINPLDLEAEGIKPGDPVTLTTRRGEITAYARSDQGTARGTVAMAFAFYEAAANKLSNPALDPFAKIPDLKYSAARLTAGGKPRPVTSYGGGKTAQAAAGVR